MRRRPAQFVVLALAQVMLCRTSAPSQATPAEVPRTRSCLSLPASEQPDGPQVTVAEVALDGDLHLAAGEKEQVVSSIKQQTYSRGVDEATSEVLERVRTGWQQHGYFKVEVRGDAKVLTTSPINQRVAVAVHVDEGRQYRFGEITFRNNRAVTNIKALRSLFPIADGDIFDRNKIAKGLESLRKAYGQMGYINFTVIPNTRVDEERQSISLEVDIDEGKQFYVKSINVRGLGGQESQNVLNDLLVKRGDIYDQRLIELFLQKLGFLSAGDSPSPSLMQLRLDDQRRPLR
jgi:outer membrane protein insertion porin family